MSHMNYPMIRMRNRNFLLSIHPNWHTKLFPESILNNEDDSLIRDVTHTNSIHKVYLARMNGMENLRPGDNILIYRTSDGMGPAAYRSVATSVCVVEEYRNINEFASLNDFKAYCGPFSVFSPQELDGFYHQKNYPHIVKFSYNFPLRRRIIRKDIIEMTGIPEEIYWGFFPLSDGHLRTILSAGGVNEGLIVD